MEENRALAVRLLPDAIRYAEEQGVQRIGIQATQTVASEGLFTRGRNYGYVWNKDAVTGAWNPYVKRTQ